MSGALFSRIKNWVTGDTILAADVNAEFDNILTNFVPLMMYDYSTNVTQMQVQTDPGQVGTESLATSLAGELERLRFKIAAIQGTTYWYPTASTSLSQLASVLGTSLTANRISSGRLSANSSQPMFLIPDGTAATIKLAGLPTNFVYSIAGTQYTISSNVSVTSLTTAPATNNTCTVNDASLSSQNFSKLVGENGTAITVTAMGSSISALVGTYAAFKTGTEYFIGRVASSTSIDKCQRGCFFTSADAQIGRTTLANAATITLMKLSWVYANTSGALTISYTNPRYTGTAPSSPATGDYWYDLTNNIWKTYNSTTWVAANATLVGICIQDTTGTKAARSFDIFKNFTDLNSVEIIRDSVNPTTQISSRYMGSTISVYGTTLKYTEDYLRWSTATDFDTGESLATNTMYYLYVKESGNICISSVAPLDMREDRLGFYHPGEAYRCVGYGRTDAVSGGQWQEVESFFQTDRSSLVTNLTAAVASLLPVPFGPQAKQRTFLVNCATTGAVTQILPPAAQYVGETFTYVRTDASIANVATIQTYASTDTITNVLNVNVASTAAVTTATMYSQGEILRATAITSNTWVVSRTYPQSLVQYTPALTANWGTATNVAVFSSRVGDRLYIRGSLTGGTVTNTAAATISMGYQGVVNTATVDTTKISANNASVVGQWHSNGTSTSGAVMITAGGNGFLLNFGIVGSGTGLTAQAAGAMIATNGFFSFFAEVPISGWTS